MMKEARWGMACEGSWLQQVGSDDFDKEKNVFYVLAVSTVEGWRSWYMLICRKCDRYPKQYETVPRRTQSSSNRTVRSC